MVLSPAPRSRRDAKPDSRDWTSVYRQAGARRARVRSVFAVSLAACAWGLIGFSARTEAEVPADANASAPAASTPAAIAPGTATPSSTTPNPAASSDTPAVAASEPPQSATPSQSATITAPVVETPKTASPVSVAPARTAPIERAMKFAVRADGKITTLIVNAPAGTTLEQALHLARFPLAPSDRVLPARNTQLSDRLHARVTRVKAVTRTRYEPVGFETRYKPTPEIARGSKQTLQNGRVGAIAIVERVWFRDGKVTFVEPLSKRVSKPAQHTIVALGTKRSYMPGNVRPHRRYARAQRAQRDFVLSYRGGSPRDLLGGQLAPANPGTFRAVKMLTVVATGYAAGRAGGAIGNITATGMPCGYGAVAVDPRVIPLGSKLYIEGYGYGFACDVGGAIKGNRIDLAFDSVRAAFANGRRTVKVWILH